MIGVTPNTSRRRAWALSVGLLLACSGAKPAVEDDGGADDTNKPAAKLPAAQCEGPAGGGGPDWLADGVGYQVWVRSFADSDGDGIGDLEGLRQRLDYINDGKPGGDDLGATVLWLSPIFTSPSDHGYDTIDHRAIQTDYGSPKQRVHQNRLPGKRFGGGRIFGCHDHRRNGDYKRRDRKHRRKEGKSQEK